MRLEGSRLYVRCNISPDNPTQACSKAREALAMSLVSSTALEAMIGVRSLGFHERRQGRLTPVF